RELLPGVGRANIAARAMHEWQRRRERKPGALLVGGQKLAAGDTRHVAIVVASTYFQMRREEHVQVQVADERRIAGQLGRQQNTRLMRIGNHLDFELVASL